MKEEKETYGSTQKWHMSACKKDIWDYTNIIHEGLWKDIRDYTKMALEC
jgi:hypothetical protein